MEHIEVTDEWLYKYMPVVDCAIIKAVESQVDDEYEFSEQFEQKMKKLIWKEAHPLLAVVQKIVKRAAAFLTGIICVGLILTMSVEAYREKFFQTLKTIYDNYMQYTYFSQEQSTKFELTEPAFLPEGYIEKKRIVSDIFAVIYYENLSGEQIIWEQKLIADKSSIILDNEYDNEEERIINGHRANVFSYLDGYAIGYYEADNYVYLITANYITSDEMFEIIASIDI